MAVKITQRSTGKTWTSGTREQEQPKQEQVESVQSTPSGTAEEPKRQWSSKSGKTVITQVKWIDEQPAKSANSQAGASNASAGAVRMEDEKEEMRRQQILGRQSEDLQKQIDALTQQEEERRKNTSLWEKIGRALSPIRSFRQEENDAEDAISKLKERKAEVDRQYQMDANQYKVYQTYQKSERPEAYTAENVGNYKQRLAALASVYGTWTKEQEQEAKEAIGTQRGGTGLLSAEKNVWAFAPYQEAVRKNDTESARQWEQIYNALYTRLYSGQEAVTSGLMQGLGFEALGDVLLHTSTEMADEAYDRWAEQKQNYAYAQSEHPYLASGARIAGSLALMSGVGKAAGAGLAATGLKTGSFWFNVARGSLTFAGVSAIQNSGAAASGDISGGDYLKSIAVSGAQGAAGNIAGELVGSGLANVLRKNGLMTPFFEFVRQTASGMSNATVNQAIGYAAADKKPTGQEIAEGLVTSFLFSALSSAISTYETTNAQKARMQQAYNQIETSYQAMAAGTENMTPEAKAQRVQLILQQTQNLRAATGEYYIAGQQKAVNNLNSALDAIEDWANNYLNGYQAAADAMQPKTALPGGTTGQIPSATVQPPVDPNLTQEVANGLQTAITQGVIQADTPQHMTGGDAAAGAAQSVSQNLQAQGLDAKTADVLVRAATEMQQEAAPAPSGGQNSVPTETVAPKQDTAQMPAQDAQESTAVNTNPAEHTKAEQAVIEAYKASADGQMRGFIEKVRSLQNNDYKNKISADVHTETTRAADTAGELTGTDTSGFKNIIKGNAVQHIDRRHGANGSADHSMANIDDFSRIGFVLDNFTDAELLPLNRVDAETAKLSREWMNSDNTQAPLVRFSMPVNGVFYVVEAVPSSKAKRLAVVSAYISRENKESTLKQVLNLSDTTGSGTPETPLAILDAPEKSLAQNGGTVKQTDASTLSSMAQTLGKSGQKAIFKAYDSKADTAEYAGEFVKVYNAARAGNDLPETKTLEPWQKYAAEVAGKNDMERVEPQESTVVNTDPAEHTKAEQDVIKAYQDSVDDGLVRFVERAIQNKGSNNSRYTLKPVSDRAAADIQEKTGVNVSGFKTVLEQRAAEHIVSRHGANGSADTSMRDMNDIGRIQYVLDNYDSLEYGGKSTAYTTVKKNGKTASADTVRYSKKVNGTYYIVEAVPNTKAKTTFIVSAYMSKTGTPHPVLDQNSPDVNAQSANAAIPVSIEADNGTQAPDAKGPENTPDASLASSLSADSSVAEQNGAVKQTGANTLDAAGVDKLVQHAAENAADHSAEWTAARVGDKKQKPKPLSEIIAGIEHDFGINITTGHARGSVRGQYSRLDNGIRTKITNDLPTVSHELGHALDREYEITGNLTDTMRGELEKSLGDLKSAYKENEWVSEGFAEYLRKYLQNSETAAIDYPEFTKHFMNSLSQRDRALVENLADEVNAYYSLDANTAQSAIRLREERVPTGDTTGDKLRAEASVLYQAWVDSLHGIKRLDEATGTNTYRLATNAAYSDAMAGQIITGNLTDANGQYVGPGLKAALHGINLKNKAEYRAFGEYLVVRHGPERLKDGMRVFADDRKNSTVFMNRRVAELEKQYPEFHNAAEQLYRFQDQLKETWLVGTGLISEETGKAWNERWKYYVPFNRAMPQGQGGAKRGFANQQNPIKRARGSGRELVHPVDNIISNVVKVVNAGVRNNVMRRITDEAQRVGADAVFLEKIPTPMRGTRVDLTGVKRDLKDQIAGKDWDNAKDFEEIVADIDDYMTQFQSGKAFGDVVTVRKNGKPEFWKVNDPLLLQSITEMSPSKVGGFIDAIGKMSHFMTSNITGNNIIWSIFSNLPRDLGTLMVYAKEPNRFKLLKEIAMSYANKLKGDSANPLYLEYLAMGGGKASYYSTDRDIAKKARKELAGGITLNPLNWISYLGDMIEQGPRFATYKCLRDRGADPQTAFYEAMDVTTNFRRGGATSRQVNKFIPFFNAGVQGADKHVRFLTGQDAPPEQRKRVVRNRMIAYFAASAGIATLFYLINNRDEESKKNYQQLSTYTKNSYFCIPIGDGKYFAVPKPRDLAVLTSAMESGLELGVGGNKHAFDGFWNYAASNYLPNVASDLAQGDIAAATGGLGLVGVISSMRANRDFLGRPIVSAGMQNLEPKDQYNDRTSMAAYWAGQAFNVSPQMTDYFFNNVLGGWWKYQKGLFPVGEDPKKIKLGDSPFGVKNSYVKDNQYSQDLVNWLYSKSDSSSRASKSDPNNISKKITAKTDGNMTTFYGNYNKLSKSDTKSTAARGTRQLVLDMIREYQKAADNKSQTDAEKEVYAICEAHGDVDILPGVMQTSIKDADGKEYSLSAVDYVEFQTDYLGIYWESVSQALDGVKGDAQRYSVLKSVKDAAKEQAKVRALKRMGAKTTTEWGDKYSGFSTYDVAYVKANADADGNGSISQAEVEALLRKMDLTNAERADLWAATNKAWAEKNNPFR